jgi:flavin reductase (DIM6/NTAB) family NADH-FMN oxidoreductase RutF
LRYGKEVYSTMKRSFGPKTLLFPTPVFLVGTYDKDDKPNVMTAAWSGICCSDPPCVSVAIRSATYTHGNLVSQKAFTLSVPPRHLVRKVDYAGIYSGRDEDKFTALGLTPVRSELVRAPYVSECPLVLECKLTHTLALGLHTLFVGEVLDAKVDEYMLDDQGKIDFQRVQPIVYAPLAHEYFTLGERLAKAFSIGKKISS